MKTLLATVEKLTLPSQLRWWVMPEVVIRGVGVLAGGGMSIFPIYMPDGGLKSAVMMYLEHIGGTEKLGVEFGCLDSREEIERKITEAVKQMVGGDLS